MSESKKSKRGRKRSLTDSERKANESAVQSKWNIYIGEQFERWHELMVDLKLQTHADLARLLLDMYYSGIKETAAPAPVATCEPVEESRPTPKRRKRISEPESPEPINLPEPKINEMDSVMSKLEKIIQLREKQAERSESPVDSFDEADHSTFTNFDFRDILNADQVENREIDEFNDINIEGEINEAPLLEKGPGIVKLGNENIRSFLSDQPLLVYREQLLMLASLLSINSTCIVSKCSRPVTIKTDVIGSAFYITWLCRSGHIIHKWCSQPLIKNTIYSGDVMIAAATVLSGNNFQKISHFAKCMNLPIPSASSFYEIQKIYVVPAIDTYWFQHQQNILQRFQGKEIVVLGHSKTESPGHSTQICSYSLMEMRTKKILCIVTMDRTFTDKTCTELEKLCFEKGMNLLYKYKIKVVEVITDANPQIADLMRRPKYVAIKHSFDIWQGMKNLCEKIIEASQERGQDNKPLLKWIREITNHFWHCALVSLSCEEFKTSWFGLLHHVVDEHDWLLSYDSNFNHNICQHDPVTEDKENDSQKGLVANDNKKKRKQSPVADSKEKKYLERGSDALNALRKIVMDKTLLNNIPYYLNCRSISDLMKFQNLITAYASTHHSYSPHVYHIRHILAALDHNKHLDRPNVTIQCGTGSKSRADKNSSSCILQEMKTRKDYQYLKDIFYDIISVHP